MLARQVRSSLHDVRQHAAVDCSTATNKCSHGRVSRLNEMAASFGKKAPGWWSQTGSNRRPHACKARALPAELWPLSQNSQPSRWQIANRSSQSERRMVGLGRFELPTSRLSSARSNQLSYKPGSDDRPEQACAPDALASAATPKTRLGLVHEERET